MSSGGTRGSAGCSSTALQHPSAATLQHPLFSIPSFSTHASAPRFSEAVATHADRIALILTRNPLTSVLYSDVEFGFDGGRHPLPDVFPLTPLPDSPQPIKRALASLPEGLTPGDARFSQSALVSMCIVGVVVRLLAYVSLRLTDRARRR